jgi:dTMP kinase
LDVRIGLSRAKTRGALDRFEKEQIDFFERVRKAYLSIAANATARCVVIDADKKREIISIQIHNLLTEKFLR